MTKVTNQQLLNFNVASEAYLKDYESKNSLAYAIKRQRKIIARNIESCQDEIQEASINLASVDEKGNLIVNTINNQSNYSYTPENRVKLLKQQNNILRREIEIENYFAQQIPDDLNNEYRSYFIDFVIKNEGVLELKD